MREILTDANTEKFKERVIKGWYACINAKGKEKQVGASSSNNKKGSQTVPCETCKALPSKKNLSTQNSLAEKKELQASKCQAASTSVQMSEGLCRKTDDGVQEEEVVLLEWFRRNAELRLPEVQLLAQILSEMSSVVTWAC